MSGEPAGRGGRGKRRRESPVSGRPRLYGGRVAGDRWVPTPTNVEGIKADLQRLCRVFEGCTWADIKTFPQARRIAAMATRGEHIDKVVARIRERRDLAACLVAGGRRPGGNPTPEDICRAAACLDFYRRAEGILTKSTPLPQARCALTLWRTGEAVALRAVRSALLSDSTICRSVVAELRAAEATDGDGSSKCAISEFDKRTLIFAGTRLMPIVPTGLREEWARTQAEMGGDVIKAHATGSAMERDVAWTWWLAAHNIFLRTRGKSRGSGRPSRDCAARRLQMWRQGDYRTLLRWTVQATRRTRPGKAPRGTVVSRAMALVRKGRMSKARRIMESLGVADINDAGVQEQLNRKHPERQQPIPGLSRSYARVDVHLKNRYRALRAGAGTGPDGCRNEYLRAIAQEFADDVASSAIEVHEKVAAIYLSAEAPGWVYDVTSASTMIALIKKLRPDGGCPDVRPIAMGGCRERAWIAQTVRQVTEATSKYLAPAQVAVGVPGGLEKMNLAIRQHLLLHPDHMAVKFDFRNAYNETWRAETLRCLEESPARSLAPIFKATHEVKGEIFGITARSEEGLRQGSPLSSMAFCVTIHKDVAWAREKLAPHAGAVFFDMDDSYAVGPPAEVVAVATQLAARLQSRCGVTLQPHKSKVYMRDPEAIRALRKTPGNESLNEYSIGRLPDTPEDAPRGGGFGIMVAGVPLGDDKFVARTLANKVDKICEGNKTITETLRMKSTQAMYALLMYCSQPRLNYEMRILHPRVLDEHLSRMDKDILDAVCVASEVDFTRSDSARALRRLRLPLRARGGGIRSQRQVAPAAYVAATIESLVALRDVMDGEEVIPGIHDAVGRALLGPTPESSDAPFAYLIHRSGSECGRQLCEIWRRLGAECASGVDGACERVLDCDPTQAGYGKDGKIAPKLQHLITTQRDAVAEAALAKEIEAESDTAREKVVWRALDDYSSRFLGSLPTSASTSMANAQFALACNNYFATAWEAFADAGRDLDKWGEPLVSKAGSTIHKLRHDTLKLCLRDIIDGANIKVWTEVRNLFTHCAPETDNVRQGLIPDLMYTLPWSSSKGETNPHPLGTLADVKCITKGQKWYAIARKTRDVDMRADMVHGEMVSRARRVDERTPGAGMVNRLQKYGRVVGLAFGAFGEVSKTVPGLLRKVAKVAAARQWRKLGARSRDEAQAQLYQKYRRLVGIMGVKAYTAAAMQCLASRMVKGVTVWPLNGSDGGLSARRPRRVSA